MVVGIRGAENGSEHTLRNQGQAALGQKNEVCVRVKKRETERVREEEVGMKMEMEMRRTRRSGEWGEADGRFPTGETRVRVLSHKYTEIQQLVSRKLPYFFSILNYFQFQ